MYGKNVFINFDSPKARARWAKEYAAMDARKPVDSDKIKARAAAIRARRDSK